MRANGVLGVRVVVAALSCIAVAIPLTTSQPAPQPSVAPSTPAAPVAAPPAPATTQGDLQAVVNGAAAGATINYSGTWTGALSIAQPVTIVGATIHGSVRITASNVTLRSVRIIGPQAGVFVSEQNAIYAESVSNLTLDGVEAGNVGNAGVRLHYVTGFTILAPYVHDAVYAGIIATSSTDGVISGGTVERIGMNGSAAANSDNAYGITLTSFGGEPKSARISVQNVVVSSVPTWHGLDTHGGLGIVFENNAVIGTYRGIVLTGPAGDGNVARGNRIEQSSRPADGRGILVSDNQHYSIDNNVIVGPLPTGIEIDRGSCGTINGNTVTATTPVLDEGSACPALNYRRAVRAWV